MTGIYFDERKELYEIKKLLSVYGMLEIRQICAYFHYKSENIVRGIIGYMDRNGLIAVTPGGKRAAISKLHLRDGPDYRLIDSFWVMLEFIKSIDYNTRAQFPAQIYFFADDVEYEVIYVPNGDENLINSIFSRETNGDTRYFVVVEEPKQIETLYIPRVEWFCTVGADGDIRKYIQEE